MIDPGRPMNASTGLQPKASAATALTRLPTAETAATWLAQRCTGALRSDSRLVQAGDAFLAWPGAQRDARHFVGQALAAGAGAALVETEGAQNFDFDASRVASLRGLKALAGDVAAAWHRQPSARVPVLAVTGTNGKTSCAWWLAQALSTCGRRCGVVGTLGIGEPAMVESTGLTTPDAVQLQAAFADFRSRGFAACAIEASSIGLVEHRLAGTHVDTALLTNLTQDHLDYHGDMATYWQAKRRLFSWPGLRAAVINVDDAHGKQLAAELQGGVLELWTVSSRGPATLQASQVAHTQAGLAFTVSEGAQHVRVKTALIGDFNVDNMLVVLGGLRSQGLGLIDAAAALSALTPVPGRLQRVPVSGDQPEVVVDYAHTPDALEKVLTALRPLVRVRGGALYCVFGCGGNRDPGKRPQMGALAARGADHVVITSDNPRQEPPLAIIEQILAGVPAHLRPRVTTQVDRRQAIEVALRSAVPSDVVLIAGKGHEDYQEIGGQRLPFSDVATVTEALKVRESLGT
jgi:MurE/MurF fusion protein